MVPFALALLVATGQIPLSTETELPSGQKVSLAADQLVYEPAKQTLSARGHTVLESESVHLRADEIVYDEANQRAYARGNVMFVSGMLVAVADEVSVDVRTLEASVKGGLFLRKKDVTREQLLAARTPWELKKAGTTVLTITGSHIKRVGKDEFLVDDLSFTPCDCDPTEPSWRVEARSAEVEIGEKALLAWPVVYVYQVPIFALPWLYVPLAERRSGLLVPRPNSTSLTGFSFEQPLFLTLGESYDLTFTPGYYFGGSNPDFGIKGGRLHTEFRYVPDEHTTGRAMLGLLYDLDPRRDPRFPGMKLEERRGLRGDLSWQHLQDLGNGWRDRIDAGFVSDGYYLNDVTTDVLARQSEYLRSTGVLSHTSEDTWFGVSAVIRQPLYTGTQPFGFDVFRQNRDPQGRTIEPPRTFARLPAIEYSIPEHPLAGPLWGGLRAEYARLSPVWGSFGDEGTDGLFQIGPDPSAPQEATQGDRHFQMGEREARDRLDLNPRLSLPLTSKYLRFTPFASFRESLYLGEYSGEASQRGYALLGATLGTTLVREFGGGALRHSLRPEAQMRYVPFVLGGVPGAAYDEVDAAISGPGMWQLVARASQTLSVRQGQTWRELLSLEVGQGFDLQSAVAADSYARLSFTQGPFRLAGVARYDIPRGTASQISAQLNYDNGHGTNLHLAYDNLLLVGSDPLRAGLDELIGRPLSLVPFDDPALAPSRYSRAEQLVGGFRAMLPIGLGLRYDAVVQPMAKTPVSQQTVGVSYGPGCDCWRLEVHAQVQADTAKPGIVGGLLGPFTGFPNVGASLTISQFGSFGSGG